MTPLLGYSPSVNATVAAGVEDRQPGNPFRSRPSTALLLSVCGSVVAGTLVVLSPLGGALGFAPLSPAFFAALAVMVVGYLVIVQALKRRVYAASGWVPDAR